MPKKKRKYPAPGPNQRQRHVSQKPSKLSDAARRRAERIERERQAKLKKRRGR